MARRNCWPSKARHCAPRRQRGCRTCAETLRAATGKFTWHENVGWCSWRDADSGSNGVNVASTFLSRFIWAENVGWINVGNGKPASGVHYANLDGTDLGVNIDAGADQLFGFAWAENIGWINLGDATHFVDSKLSFDCNSNSPEDARNPDFDADELIDECDPDIDRDSVDNGLDVCNFTPDSVVVGGRAILDPASSLYGTIHGDYDGDCNCDLVDYAESSLDFTEPNAVP